jgi:hypothetical protein
VTLQATFAPTQSWLESSRSEPASVVIGKPKPVPIGTTLAAFAATSLALLSFVGLRTRPWEKLRSAKNIEDGEPARTGGASEVPPPTGLSPARPRRVSSLRRPAYFDLRGQVRDALTSAGIGGAELLLTRGTEDAAQERADDSGRFELPPLSEGSFTVRVRAHGYVSEQFDIQLPHKGELHGAHVDLMPVREKIFALYRGVARPLLPSAELWGIWTPRQILDHVRRLETGQALAELTDFVEDSFFSQRTPGEELIDVARDKIARVQEERESQLPQA